VPDIPPRGIRHHISGTALVKFKRQGLTTKQIADRMGCSDTTVERAMRRYGLFPPTRPTFVDRIDPKRLAKLRRDGLKVTEIAERLGYSKRTIERALQRYGIGR
jgi:transposase